MNLLMVCLWIRLEQEIEELETGVPAKKGVANENGGKLKAHCVTFKGI